MVVTAWLVWSVFLSAFVPRQDAREIALTFTRPTIVATPLELPVTFWHELTFEDNEYMFVSRHYGTGGKHVPGFFVYSKSRGAWIQISRISTEHARLGRPPEGQGMRLADLQRAFVQDGRDRLLKIRRLGVERTTTLKMLAIR